jgi:PAS domain-containing protein
MTDAAQDFVSEEPRRFRSLECQLSRRAVIEQAKGVLCARHGIDPDAAFEHLLRRSQNSNVKVVDVAAELVAAQTTTPTALEGPAGTWRLLDGMVSSVMLLRALRDETGDVIDMEIDYANPVAVDLNGQELSTFVGRGLRRVFRSVDVNGMWQLYRTALLEQRPYRSDRLHVLPFDPDRIMVTWVDEWDGYLP